MSPDTLTELDRLEAAATPGPVEIEPDGCVRSVDSAHGKRALCWCAPHYASAPNPLDLRNARLVAALRNNAPELIRAAREREEAIGLLRAMEPHLFRCAYPNCTSSSCTTAAATRAFLARVKEAA